MGRLTLRQFIEANKNPKEDIKEIFSRISEAASKGDLGLKSKLKKQLYFFTPCVLMKGWRSYENIEAWNGVLMGDIDNIPYAKELRDYIFETFPEVICSLCSVSGYGVKFFIRIPICTSIEEFKSYAYGFFETLQYFTGFDPATKNCTLPCFLSMDPDIKYRENPEIWTKKGGMRDEFPESSIDLEFEANEKLDRKGLEGVANQIKNTVGRADIESIGHRWVVAASLIAGGMSSYYKNIDENRMLEYLLGLIENSTYLQKDLKGYKKTCRHFFREGLLSPIPYRKN